MSNITITSSDDFNQGSHKVAFDYMLLKSSAHSLVGEKVDIKNIKVIEKLDSCETEDHICFLVEISDGRMFEAHAKAQVYAKISVGSDPILSYQNPPISGVERGATVLQRVAKKVAEAIQCGTCSG